MKLYAVSTVFRFEAPDRDAAAEPVSRHFTAIDGFVRASRTKYRYTDAEVASRRPGMVTRVLWRADTHPSEATTVNAEVAAA